MEWVGRQVWIWEELWVVCVCVCMVCVCVVCVMYLYMHPMLGAFGGWQRSSDPLDLELWMVVRYHGGAGN